MSQVNVNPGGTNSGSGAAAGMSVALILSLIVLVALLVVAYFVLWPMLSTPPQPAEINVNIR
ncbi:MAG: hypothetical protein ACRDI2_16315 [Chloroflexota bacterium]